MPWLPGPVPGPAAARALTATASGSRCPWQPHVPPPPERHWSPRGAARRPIGREERGRGGSRARGLPGAVVRAEAGCRRALPWRRGAGPGAPRPGLGPEQARRRPRSPGPCRAAPLRARNSSAGCRRAGRRRPELGGRAQGRGASLRHARRPARPRAACPPRRGRPAEARGAAGPLRRL